ncbi:uncharacterized protein LOC131614032 [Vicia villosa]|uniref:uncharacterized protein LOC131614032 n=1 Tax=Vicia villosa TaxID=3911 RepID=UPI00273A8E58|nr:uncharacterized protein LOC131614032 [Vicia villosa]
MEASEDWRLLQILCLLLSTVVPILGQQDTILWLPTVEEGFSVRSCYGYLVEDASQSVFERDCEKAIGLILKSPVPFRIKPFLWRCLINKLPMKKLLFIRGLFTSQYELLCVNCNNCEESLEHVMLFCFFAKEIWRAISGWIGVVLDVGDNLWNSYLNASACFKSLKVKKGFEGVVWATVCWSIWVNTNAVIFRNERWNIFDSIWNIKLLIWKWSFFGEIAYAKCNFYEFCKDLIHFLS